MRGRAPRPAGRGKALYNLCAALTCGVQLLAKLIDGAQSIAHEDFHSLAEELLRPGPRFTAGMHLHLAECALHVTNAAPQTVKPLVHGGEGRLLVVSRRVRVGAAASPPRVCRIRECALQRRRAACVPQRPQDGILALTWQCLRKPGVASRPAEQLQRIWREKSRSDGPAARRVHHVPRDHGDGGLHDRVCASRLHSRGDQRHQPAHRRHVALKGGLERPAAQPL
mmetsp:Transcript_21931/g.73766  ORF Transcript_21931/g.73766 Transcript_21931/m.73766 type:complete len:225 (-) Transcript_21931:171-845(-)